MNIKKLTDEDLDAIAQDINEVMGPIAKKYGVSIACEPGSFLSDRIKASFSLEVQVVAPEGCSEKAKEFGFFLAEHKLDDKFGLSWEDYGKAFRIGEMTFRIVGAFGSGVNASSISVVSDGNLYQLQPDTVAEALHGIVKPDKAKKVRKYILSQTVLHSLRQFDVNMYANKRSWDWAARSFPLYRFQPEDYCEYITLYGKKYIIQGFFTIRPYQSVIVEDETGNYFKVPAYKVTYALGRLGI